LFEVNDVQTAISEVDRIISTPGLGF